MRAKIILAAMVIFLAGLATGWIATRAFPPIDPAPHRPLPAPAAVNPERGRAYLERLDREVNLTPEQRARMEEIITQSQDRVRALWDPIAPQVRDEFRAARRQIASLLTPEQKQALQQARRSRQPRPNSPHSQIDN